MDIILSLKIKGFNPLIQVNDFYSIKISALPFVMYNSFNPLIQVNDFYNIQVLMIFLIEINSFNPLIQVNDFYIVVERLKIARPISVLIP